MEQVNLASLTSQVIWLTFLLGAVLGAVAQRTHFCTMGAVADVVNFGDWNRMRQWLLAIAVAMLGTNLLAYSGQIDLTKALYTTARFTWLSYLVGGALFGFGMVLASGCGSKTLVRIGGGNLKSLVVFIVLGLTAFMTLKGILALPRTLVLDAASFTLPTTQDIPSIVASFWGDKPTMMLVFTGLFALLLLIFVFASPAFRTLENIMAGAIVGLVIVAAWYVSGHIGHLAEHPDTLEEAFLATNSGRMESFSFVAPYAYTLDWLMMWTDASKLISFGISASLGVVAGSFALSLATRAFRWEGFGGVEDTANHVVGAMLMGFGGVTALGCTIGQGLSGLSTLAVGSMLTFGAIIVGAIAALRYQAWRMESMI